MTFRNPAAERQRPQEADQIESRNKKLHALLCSARAVPFSQGLTMRSQGACPLRSLGVSKGPFSTVENGPFDMCAAHRAAGIKITRPRAPSRRCAARRAASA